MKPGRKITTEMKPAKGAGATLAIPQDFLDELGIKASHNVTLTLRGDRTMVIRPAEDDEDLLAEELEITASVARTIG